MNIQYFRASEEHLDILVALRLEVLQIFQGEQSPEAIEALRPHLVEVIGNGLRAESYICWLAQVGNEIVGAGGLTIRTHPGNFTNPSGRVGYIMSMYTLPAYRRMGICSELVQRLVSSGKELGITNFELHATKAGEPVYQKLGFKLHNEPTYRMYEPSA